VKEKLTPSAVSKYFALAAPALVVALLALLLMPLASRAQDTGYISGTVTDKTGAAVANAEVVITSQGENLTRNTTTNSDGAYVGSALPAGTYDVVVTAAGFQKYQAKGVVLPVAQKLRVDVVLTVGAVNEEITVSGESVAQVETQSSDISSTITGKQVNELELNGRNFTQLVTLAPGVVSQTNQDEGTVGVNGNVSYSINGGRTEYNNWEIDGGDNMDNGSNTTLNVYPNIEAIAEFKVLTSNYGAQYGRNASGTIEVETKSGTNNFHGSAFEYLRNDMFNARPWESGADPTHPNPPYKKHDFGYTVGGPIYIPHLYNTDKKKTFFFFSEEWRREKNPHQYNVKVPSDAERGGDFSDLCPGPDCPHQADGTPFPGNIVPIDPNAQFLLAVLPQANGTNNGFPAYTNSTSLPTTWREELVRVDHNITDNYRLTFRYIHDSWQTITPGPLWGAGTSSFPNVQTGFAGPGTSFVARLTANITPSLLNEFVASYTADHIILTAIGPVALSGYTGGSLFPNGFEGKLPAFSFSGNAAYGGIADGTDQGNGVGVDTGYFPWKNANPTYTYRDNLTKIAGNHTMTIGAYFVFAQKNQENSLNQQGILSFDSGSANSTGNSFADLLGGNIASYSQAANQIIFYDRYKIFEPYFQDDWRITKRFTLNLGLRWSFFGRYQERYNTEFGFTPSQFSSANALAISPDDGSLVDPNTGLPVAAGDPRIFNGFIQCGKGGAPSGCLKNKLMNPAPRLGFAWDPRGDGKMAVRGGYGIFFEHQNGNEANAEVLQQGASPLILLASQNNVVGYSNIGSASVGLSPQFPLSPFSIPDQAEWPYVQQWNLDVQRELPGHFITSVAYVGSKGTHLTLQRDLNQLHSVPAGENPFAPGQPIVQADCDSLNGGAGTLSNGTPLTAAASENLSVACGNDANPFRPFQGYGGINRIETTANSIYNALQLSVRRTVGAFNLSLAYTYSHSIDDSSDRSDTTFVDSYDPGRTRASSNFDVRHNFVASYVYSVPFRGTGFARTALGGWQVSGITTIQSGTPITVTNGTAFGDNAGVGNGLGSGSFPDLVGDARAVTAGEREAGAGVTGPLFYSPDAYALPTGLTFGDSGRNTLNLPRRVNFDAGLFKRFQIKERAAFEFRWEIFNVFNHTQFNAIDTTFGSDSFLHATGAHAPRRMQLGLRFQF
jgi:hypothetical protein